MDLSRRDALKALAVAVGVPLARPRRRRASLYPSVSLLPAATVYPRG